MQQIQLPKIQTDQTIFESTARQPNVLFDKQQKCYILKISSAIPFNYIQKDSSFKANKLHIQIYLFEKLKLQMESIHNGQIVRLQVCPKIVYQKTPDEVFISSAFVLTKKWISLCFDLDSLFSPGEFQLQHLYISSSAKLRKIYEATTNDLINDGFCLVQKISDKRINELLPASMRAQTEKKDQRKPNLRRKSTVTEASEIEETRKSVPIKRMPPIINSHTNRRQPSQHTLEKTIKIATGLQVIAEIQPKKPPLFKKQIQITPPNKIYSKKAVNSFIRHTQEIKNQSQASVGPKTPEEKQDHESFKCSQFTGYKDNETDYQTKYGRFSSTFQKPLGVSSMNHKLVSQLSGNQATEYFYISSQQFHQPQSPEHTQNEIEEQIDVPEQSHRNSSGGGIIEDMKQQLDSSEELAVSKFE